MKVYRAQRYGILWRDGQGDDRPALQAGIDAAAAKKRPRGPWWTMFYGMARTLAGRSKTEDEADGAS